MLVARGQALGVALPALVFIHQVRGSLVDPTELSFQVFDTSDDAKYLQPSQVFPVAAGTWQPVNLVTEKLGLGRFAATWTVPASAPAGAWEVRWRFRSAAGEPLREARQTFEVLQGTSAPPLGVAFYGSLKALRDEGITQAQASDAKLLASLARASKYIERVTGREFRALYKTLELDGDGGRALLLDEPIIGVESIKLSTSPLFPSDLEIEADFFRVYNRHLSQNLVSPDDRNNPKIEMFSSSEDLAGIRPFTFSRMIFPRGQQNVRVAGVFGFTDFDGTPMGATPEDIKRVALLLALRDMPKMGCASRFQTTQGYRLKGERTRDQSYDLDGLHLRGAFTGDPEIDQTLAAYVRPPMFGAA